MKWTVVHNVVLLSLIGMLQCQTVFKSRELCKDKRDVTIVLDLRIIDDKIKWPVWEEQQGYLEKFNYLIKTLKNDLDKEACLKLSLIKYSMNGFVRVNELLDDRATQWHAKSIKDHNADLKEFLRLYENQSTRKRTLVLLLSLIHI